jgi:NAD dependent epimerase/dehydratase family enzyme
VVHAQIFAAQTVELNGPDNFAAPDGVTNAEATAAIAGALHRPAFLTIHAFALRLSPGGMAEEILLNGSRAVPQKLLDAGYRFRQPELRPALEEMLSSRSGRD